MKVDWKKMLFIGAVGMVLAACGNGEESGEQASEDTSWQDIEEAGVLTVGTSGSHFPITYVDEENNLTGYDIEVLREVGEELDIEVEFESMEFDAILPALRNGQIDVAANDMAITSEREEIFDFTTPHKISYGTILTLEEHEDEFDSAWDLEGKEVALGSLTSNYALFADAIGAETTAYDGGIDPIIRDTLNGNTYGYLNDVLTLTATKENHGDERLFIDEDVKYHPSYSAFPVLQGNTSLEAELSGAIETLLDDGTIAQISEEFFNGVDATQPIDEEEVVTFEDVEEANSEGSSEEE